MSLNARKWKLLDAPEDIVPGDLVRCKLRWADEPVRLGLVIAVSVKKTATVLLAETMKFEELHLQFFARE